MSLFILNKIWDLVDRLEESEKVKLSAELFSYFDVNKENCNLFLNELTETDREELYLSFLGIMEKDDNPDAQEN